MMQTAFDTWRRDRAQTDEERNVLTNIQAIYNILQRYLDLKFVREISLFNSRLLNLCGFVARDEIDRPSRLLVLMTHHKICVDDVTCLTRVTGIPDDWDVQADTQIIKKNMCQIMSFAKTSKYLKK